MVKRPQKTGTTLRNQILLLNKALAISGSATLGQTLAISTVPVFDGPVLNVSYQWLRDSVAISGANSSTYVSQVADIGKTITLSATAKTARKQLSVISNNIGPIIEQAPTNTAIPVISGTPTVGQTLTTTNGTWTNSPTGYTYQWKRDGANISGATSSTYLLVSGDTGTTITVTVTASNTGGSGNATSAGVGPISA